MYQVLFNSCRAPVEIAKWLNDELALGNKFIACNGDFYIFEAVEHHLHADGATHCPNCCNLCKHENCTETCPICNRPAGNAIR